MNYLSLQFAGFVLLLAVLYYIAQIWSFGWGVLLLGSLVFYSAFDVRYLMFLGFAACSTYVCARLLPKIKKKKLCLILCITANVLIWFVLKALPWAVLFGNSVLNRMGFLTNFSFTPLLVPVGISYFTLQAIGYLADVYKGKIEPEKNPAKYLLFISYFPAIVQGPISRYNELMPELLNRKRFSFESMRKGLILVLFGVVKKMVIADRLAIFVNACFDGFHEMSGLLLYLGAVGYAVQLYMDFSGCVDICRGVSYLFNVELTNNFDRPYLSKSVKEFWARWHLSLSRWLKDYVYIPLGGNRKGTARKYLNLLVTFLVSGLWHGAGFNFFLWGALHAVYQIIGQMTEKLRAWVKEKLGVHPGSVSEKIFKTVITFNLVTLSWVFFRSASMMEGFTYLSQMFSEWNIHCLFGPLFEMGINRQQFFVIFLHLIVFFVAERCTKTQASLVEGVTKQHIVIRWIIYYVLFMDIVLFGVYGSGYDLAGFMYGGF